MSWLILVVLIVNSLHFASAQDPACKTENTCDCCNSRPNDGTRRLLDICNNKQGYWACKYGCKDGYWGGRCWHFCPYYCTKCAREFGTSDHSDYQKCNLCANGYYNGPGITNCSTPCPANCAANQCDTTTGICLRGCSNNWIGIKCNVCPNSWYGNNCNIPCPINCKDRKCLINGNCINGCSSDKFNGSKCDQCITGKYGDGCDIDCSANCINDLCHKDSGNCTIGCDVNFVGDKCDKCRSNFYGRNCDKECSNCLNGVCEQTTGRCIECVNGKFGELCDRSCSTGCKHSKCDRITATCLQGCLFGLSGDRCCVFSQGCEICDKDTGNCESCKEGKFYGDKCGTPCSTKCFDGKCDKEDGQCGSCVRGFYGPQCNLICPKTCLNGECLREDGACIFCQDGYYGKTCNKTCPDNCLNNLCGQYDGICYNCSVGYYSMSCDFNCPSDCINETCNQRSGECTFGCSNGCLNENICYNVPQTSCYTGEIIGGMFAGFTIITLLSHVLCFMCRRRQSKENKKDPPTHINTIYENDKADHDGYEELQFRTH